jgi:hypothetical protein
MMPSLEDSIARYGWAVQIVADRPLFAYTIGLADKGLPEVIMFGLPPKVMHQFLNIVGLKFTKEGVPPLDTDLLDLAERFPARLLPAPRAVADLYMHQARFRNENYTAVQLVWPDKRGAWPWEPAYEAPASAQPILRDRAQ